MRRCSGRVSWSELKAWGNRVDECVQDPGGTRSVVGEFGVPGSGPGSATIAARGIWPSESDDLMAVERSKGGDKRPGSTRCN